MNRWATKWSNGRCDRCRRRLPADTATKTGAGPPTGWTGAG